MVMKVGCTVIIRKLHSGNHHDRKQQLAHDQRKPEVDNFFDIRWIIQREFGLFGNTVNSPYYFGFLKSTRTNVLRKFRLVEKQRLVPRQRSCLHYDFGHRAVD